MKLKGGWWCSKGEKDQKKNQNFSNCIFDFKKKNYLCNRFEKMVLKFEFEIEKKSQKTGSIFLVILSKTKGKAYSV